LRRVGRYRGHLKSAALFIDARARLSGGGKKKRENKFQSENYKWKKAFGEINKIEKSGKG